MLHTKVMLRVQAAIAPKACFELYYDSDRKQPNLLTV
jgi:hypothetical protein